jgi:hypothetical protein
MIPASFPDQNKFDVANSVVEDLLSFKTARSQVQHRVGAYVTAYYQMYPTKYARFGESPAAVAGRPAV